MLRNAKLMPTLPAYDLERASRFYRDKLGLRPLEESSGDGVVFECGNNNFLYIYETDLPRGGHTLATFIVDDLELEMNDMRIKGIEFEQFDLPELKTFNDVLVRDGAKSSWFKDPEGNVLSLTELSPEMSEKTISRMTKERV